MSNAEEKVKSLLGCDKNSLTAILVDSIMESMTQAEKQKIVDKLETGTQ